MAKKKTKKGDEVVKLDISFEELVNMSVQENPKPKESTKKSEKKK